MMNTTTIGAIDSNEVTINKKHLVDMIKTILRFDDATLLEQHIRKHGLNLNICERAAKHGSIKCLQWAHEHGYTLNYMTCVEAIKSNKLNCLKYAIQHGCEQHWIVCVFAAMYNRLDCLEYLYENNYAYDHENVRIVANKTKSDECLNFACVKQPPCYMDVYVMADFHLDVKTCVNAIHKRKWECMKRAIGDDYQHEFIIALGKYAAENGCPANILEILSK